MQNIVRKSTNVNTDNARGKVVPGAQNVHPVRKVAGPVTKAAYTRKSAGVNADNLPGMGGDSDGQKLDKHLS